MAQIHKHGLPSKVEIDESLVMVNLSSSSIILRQSSHPLRIRFLRIRYFLYFMFLHRSLVFMNKSIYDSKELRLIFPLLFSPRHFFNFVYFTVLNQIWINTIFVPLWSLISNTFLLLLCRRNINTISETNLTLEQTMYSWFPKFASSDLSSELRFWCRSSHNNIELSSE